jgi:ElaB/YqjD/DUF883 family membrane-anchored ribosome-binding protein
MLSGEMHNLITDIEDLVKKATSLTGEELTAAKARLTERLDAARVTFAEAGETVANKARNTATATNEYVHEQPWKAIGIGATVGLLLGFALEGRGSGLDGTWFRSDCPLLTSSMLTMRPASLDAFPFFPSYSSM